MDIDRAGRDVNIVAPYRLQKIIAADDFGWSLHQQRQDLELLVGQFHNGLALQDLVFPQIHRNAGAPDRVATFFRGGTP